MRLWTLHPKHLDARGLVALWREALLAQAVLLGRTRGYTHHPQLQRFRSAADPQAAIAAYLRVVQAEAERRGYRFDVARIVASGEMHGTLPATLGQIDYEWQHLQAKLAVRDPAWLAEQQTVRRPDPHPLFELAPGPIAAWERNVA